MSPPDITIFDRILTGEIPCHRVYENDHVLAFLDISPLAPGHTLLIPKERQAQLHQLPDQSAGALGLALPRIARAVMAISGAEHYNVLQNNGAPAGQSVFHVHFHIIPRLPEGGLRIDWRPGALEPERGEAQAQTMRAHIQTEQSEGSGKVS